MKSLTTAREETRVKQHLMYPLTTHTNLLKSIQRIVSICLKHLVKQLIIKVEYIEC